MPDRDTTDQLFSGPVHSTARSHVKMTHHVLPEFANSLGNVFDGQVRIGRTGRLFKERPRSTPGKTALLFTLAVR